MSGRNPLQGRRYWAPGVLLKKALILLELSGVKTAWGKPSLQEAFGRIELNSHPHGPRTLDY